MKLKIILTGFILSLFLTLSYKSTTLNNPPKVEIISPINNSIIHEKFANFSIKCSDDTYVISLIIEYGDLGGNGGIAIGLKNKTYFFNFTHYASPGYNWIVATAYDEFGNYGQNISIYYYETPKKPYPQGKPPSVKIISPSNGEVICSRDVKVLVECKSDKNIVAVSYAWGGKNGGGGGVKVYFLHPLTTPSTFSHIGFTQDTIGYMHLLMTKKEILDMTMLFIITIPLKIVIPQKLKYGGHQ